MPNLRRLVPKTVVPGVAALLLGTSAAAAAHASPAPAPGSAVIEVQAPGAAGGPPSPGQLRAGSVHAAEA
ncbi:MAG: hypothetical protein ACRDN0_11485, partial [Trebonia sp.]